ncbi:MAG: penicillin-binding protein 2 [Candidatus Jacksonbacteria bacterium]|jgi:cell division protein FtsI (penicillin-binding protein 3)|nr:penicillin-binding protein 2 [Candidatus Jacksonbacteria bacterium]MBT6034151.1 penicillin-binding protein 2 [Candidatus Jacksonbacteria bacterium]MBT6301286.1 penicillin-binding protein 2 [Candidatus Jacksonbacteria bacterium]MBT6756828.1 penicillin-binding protein 2 [Candidatus Jacksonbacteria bacterium]MBT7008244.1 penicillin-binding protein 2 [Candidatus Jacksonbacteria bacterium]
MEKRRSRSKEKRPADRLTLVSVVFFIFVFGIVARLFSLQVIDHKTYVAKAQGQHGSEQLLLPERGEIYWSDGVSGEEFVAATNKTFWRLYAVPEDIYNPKRIAEEIAPIIAEEAESLLPRLDKPKDPYEPIKDRLSDAQVQAIKALQFNGLGFRKESQRFYPEGSMGGSILGFVNWASDDRKGQYGIEQYFEKELAGNAGSLRVQRDVQGRPIIVGERFVSNPIDGDKVILTIDRTVQFTACGALTKAVEKHSAEGGSVIVLDPHSGKIIAMCSAPGFNPNEYGQVETTDSYINQATAHTYEPGSTFKAITMAIGLENEAVTPETTYEDEGKIKYGPYTIKNALQTAEGVQTMTQVLQKSLNTGAVYVGDAVGKELFREGVKKFGFGEAAGVELAGEIGGDISSLDKRGEIFLATATFGQGITTTPLQMALAFAALGNGGVLYKPYIVDYVRKPDGEKIQTEPVVVGNPISPRTSLLISGMLGAVVEGGYSGQARVEGYHVAGKSGTAQVAGEGGGYSGDTIHSFIGYAPVENPEFVILVKLDKVKTSRFAQGSALPLFKDIAGFLLKYYKVEPTK